MFDYKLLEDQLNEEVKKILLLIKQDYYDTFSDEKKSLIDTLLESDSVVVVNQGLSHFNDNTLAHGGRTLGDGKIHFYPDVSDFKSLQESFDTCKKLLPHECFHYFMQSNGLEYVDELEEEIADFYAEGLVEKEARIFYKRHKDIIAFEKANYGFNINFVNMIQDELGLSTFNESDYLRNIGKFKNMYYDVIKNKKALLDSIPDIIKDLPISIQKKVFNRIRTMILQDGNERTAMEKLQLFMSSNNIKSEEHDELM